MWRGVHIDVLHKQHISHSNGVSCEFRCEFRCAPTAFESSWNICSILLASSLPEAVNKQQQIQFLVLVSKLDSPARLWDSPAMWLHNLPTNLHRMSHSDSVKCCHTTCLIEAKHHAAVVQSHRTGEWSVPNAPDSFAGKEGIYKCSGWGLLVLPRTDNENPQASLCVLLCMHKQRLWP